MRGLLLFLDSAAAAGVYYLAIGFYTRMELDLCCPWCGA